MSNSPIEALIPTDFAARLRDEAARGNVPYILLRPQRDADLGQAPQPIAIVFGPTVPRVGERIEWENGEDLRHRRHHASPDHRRGCAALSDGATAAGDQAGRSGTALTNPVVAPGLAMPIIHASIAKKVG